MNKYVILLCLGIVSFMLVNNNSKIMKSSMKGNTPIIILVGVIALFMVNKCVTKDVVEGYNHTAADTLRNRVDEEASDQKYNCACLDSEGNNAGTVLNNNKSCKYVTQNSSINTDINPKQVCKKNNCNIGYKEIDITPNDFTGKNFVRCGAPFPPGPDSNPDDNCLPGYHYDGNTCTQNICECDNGAKARGVNCPSDGMEYCTSCNEGYYAEVDSNGHRSCKQKVCECPHTGGVAAEGTECPANGSYKCTDCGDVGNYRLTPDGICVPSACPVGQHPDFDNDGTPTCVDNICKCVNGQNATGADCLYDGANICDPVAPCNDRYFYDSNTRTCQEAQCFCPYGTPLRGDACKDAHSEGGTNFTEAIIACESGGCHDGYHYLDDTKECQQNTCTCTGGKANIGSACTVNNEESCASCYTHLGLKETPTNLNGRVVCTNNCSHPGDYYDIKKEECSEKVCACTNGTPRRGTDCEKDGELGCESCFEDYELDSNNGCVPKQESGSGAFN